MTNTEIERIKKLAEALRKKAGHEDKEFPEPDDYYPHAGGDFSRSCAAALDAILAENDALRKGYGECLDDMIGWAAYANEYFQEKHDLAGNIQRHRAALQRKPAK